MKKVKYVQDGEEVWVNDISVHYTSMALNDPHNANNINAMYLQACLNHDIVEPAHRERAEETIRVLSK